MKKLEEYLYPSTAKEALKLLSESETSDFIAGGTGGVRGNVTRLVDITKLGLSNISKDGSIITIGSTSTLTEIYENNLVQEIGNGVLKKAAQLCADTPLRNTITLGGNIAHLYVWAGLPVVLLILDAEIEILKANGDAYRISAKNYFEGNGITRGELIKNVHFPIQDNWRHYYEKFCLTTVDYTWLTIAFAVKTENGKITDSRVAVSRITKVRRVEEIEKMLEGQIVSQLDVEKIVSTLQSTITVSKDYRSSKEYRRQLLGVLFKRMLGKLMEESQ